MRAAAATPLKIRGYTDRQSVAQGGTIQFCIAAPHGGASSKRPVRIIRIGRVETEVASGLAAVRAVPGPVARAWENNQWETGYALTVGRDWRPGVYVARTGEAADDRAEIFFVVKTARPGAAAPIVVQIPTTTINAYNNWGGASLYGYNSYPSPAAAVSFNRPQQSDPLWPRGYGFKDEWDLRIKAFVQWLETMGYAADFIANNDLHEDESAIDGYRLFVSIGHDEYWSRPMRARFDAFVASGGNAAILGGNTCYWQTRLEPDEATGAPNRRQVCYKNAATDPVADPALKTVTWREAGHPENASFGAGFGTGAGAWRGTADFGAFETHHPDHWAFRDTGLGRGDRFGDAADEQLLGYETNGVDYALDRRGRPVPSGSDGTPKDYLILALADLPHWGTPGNAAMGVFTNPVSGGTVFNAATTDWAKGLAPCLSDGSRLRTVTAKITRNVIDRLVRPKQGGERAGE
jgi:hypothetical protein